MGDLRFISGEAALRNFIDGIEADACVVGNALLDSAPDDDGWRTWNLGRQEAREATAGLGSRLPNGYPRP